jgi:hypothetical protein
VFGNINSTDFENSMNYVLWSFDLLNRYNLRIEVSADINYNGRVQNVDCERSQYEKTKKLVRAIQHGRAYK